MESGRASLYHQLMGIYYATVAAQGLTDERRWPTDLSPIELEERRRLSWHMYRLEVHTSLILGHTIRSPELQVFVDYPENPTFDIDAFDGHHEWLTGWNFVTDLYRALEHLLVHFRSRKQISRAKNQTTLPIAGFLSDAVKAQLLLVLRSSYEALPRRFKKAKALSANIGKNRCIYQTANIICTYEVCLGSCAALLHIDKCSW